MTDQKTIDMLPQARTLLRRIADHNPFFLISGVLMLAGCFMISGSAHDDPDVIWPVVGLVAVFNVYEGMIIALGIYLSRVRRFTRDAGFLLMLEVLLLCDVSLTYNELLLKSLPIGLVVSSTALALVGVKLLLLDWGLGLRTTKTGAWLITTLIAMLFVLPGLFRELIRMDLLREGHFYAAWWVLAAVPLVTAISQPWFILRPSNDLQLDKLRLWTTRLLIMIPLASLLLHLCAAHYVNDRPIHLYILAPLVLGLTWAWVYRRSRSVTVQRVVATTFAAGCAAVALSASFPASMAVPIYGGWAELFSPLRLVMVVTAVLFTYVWLWRGAWVCLPAALGLVFTAGLGHTVSAIGDRAQALIQRARALCSSLLPESIAGWGAVATAASFVFLALGAATSLVKHTPRAENEPR